MKSISRRVCCFTCLISTLSASHFDNPNGFEKEMGDIFNRDTVEALRGSKGSENDDPYKGLTEVERCKKENRAKDLLKIMELPIFIDPVTKLRGYKVKISDFPHLLNPSDFPMLLNPAVTQETKTSKTINFTYDDEHSSFE